MLYTLLLPTLFSFAALVGLGLLVNGLSGLLLAKGYAPELAEGSRSVFTVQSGEEARRWGRNSLLAGLPLLLLAGIGFYQLSDFIRSPAYLRILLPPPDGYHILYAEQNDGEHEIAYGFDLDVESLKLHFARELESKGYQVNTPTRIQVIGERGDRLVSVSFVGSQPGDDRQYRSTAIVTFR